jgi:hypothetical protein
MNDSKCFFSIYNKIFQVNIFNELGKKENYSNNSIKILNTASEKKETTLYETNYNELCFKKVFFNVFYLFFR